MARRIMREFRLDKIAAVDNPCQEHAKMTIIKRAADEYWKRDFTQAERDKAAESGAALPDGSFPIETTADLENAVHAIGRAQDEAKAKAHIISRAKSLGATDLLPDGWVSKSTPTTGDGEMDLKELQKMIDAAVATATADLKKNLDDATAKVASLTKMSERHSAFAANLKAKMPKGGKDAFTAMSPAERDAHMAANPIADNEPDEDDAKKMARAVAKAVADEEVLKVGDVEIRKSAVGESAFAIYKAQADEIAKLRDAGELAAFEKRAATELPSLPGLPIAKAKVLRAIEKMDKDTAAALDTMLKAGNVAMRLSMVEKGHSRGDTFAKASDEMDALVTDHMGKHSVSKAAAYDAVLKTDRGRALYQEMDKAAVKAA